MRQPLFQQFLHRLFNKNRPLPVEGPSAADASIDLPGLTGKDFEFLITPGDLDIPASAFDSLLTPDSIPWTKTMRKNWFYYQVDGDEFTYSLEPPGIQMTFNASMPYPKAKAIADEVVRKLTAHTGQPIELLFIAGDRPIRFDMGPPLPTATFRIKAAFQLTGRSFFLLGDLLSGKIKKGMIVDLAPIGIDKKLVIEAIEFALHWEEGKGREDTGLGVSGLTEAEKEVLKKDSPFSNPITIR